MSAEGIEDIPIHDDAIRLGQLVKLANLAEDGAGAKELIEHGLVTVNSEVETRRGRRVHVGDVVTAGGESVRVTSG